MSINKYRYNPKTLSFEQTESALKDSFWKFFKFLITSIFLTIFLYFLFSSFIDSPKERKLRSEVEWLTQQYGLLNKQLDEVDSVLSVVRHHDDRIYRVIFEAGPIPEAIRNAGFGGVNRYKKMEGYENSEMAIETARRLDILLTQMYIQTKSYDELLEYANVKKDMLACIPAIQPVANKDLKKISSGFGMRKHPILGIRRFHSGMDFSIPVNSKVFVTGKGVVEKIVRSRQGKGNYIVVDHGFGYKTVYAHLSQILVSGGDLLQRGDIIGLSGNS
ncbi:MAG: M23 family metallopeptidase, partial [Bacteroidetes bacterium]|nr:M23 family metallopeptidase [Bacteroidota bacterium]